MNGILLIDKPAGITSHTVVSKLRKKLGIKKIGHAGTLDPSATGLLLICVGEATKVSGYLTDSYKIYETKVIFGKTTNTYDLEGEIVSEKPVGDLSIEKIESVTKEFIGPQKQKPPMFSAVKIAGKKLYEYARAEVSVDVPDRNVHITSIELLSYEKPLAMIRTRCSKGTYIRSLVHDIGHRLGVGATVEVIRRIQSGTFDIQNALPLETWLKMDLSEIENKIMPIKTSLQGRFHMISISGEDVVQMRHGVEYSKSKVDSKDIGDEPHSDSMVLFLSKSSGLEIAIGQWGTTDKIQIKRVFISA